MSLGISRLGIADNKSQAASGGGPIGGDPPQLEPPSNLSLAENGQFALIAFWTDPPSIPNELVIELWRSDYTEQVSSNSVFGGSGAYNYDGLSAYESIGMVVRMRNIGDGVTNLTSVEVESNPVNVPS